MDSRKLIQEAVHWRTLSDDEVDSILAVLRAVDETTHVYYSTRPERGGLEGGKAVRVTDADLAWRCGMAAYEWIHGFRGVIRLTEFGLLLWRQVCPPRRMGVVR